MLFHAFPCVFLTLTSILWAAGKIAFSSQKQTFSRFPLVDRTVCRTTPGLSKSQLETCRKQPDATREALEGIRLAIKECQFQFQGHRWNCSSLAKKAGNPYTSSIFNKGYKETAFAYAISSAGVVIAVAKACSQGKLVNCNCSVVSFKNASSWKWKGCSHNIEHGIKFSRKFLDSRETANDMHSKVNLHNLKVGRLMVAENTEIRCKCHGLSGSCEIKTCFKIAPSVRKIGERLKSKLDEAIRITPTNINNGKRRNSNRVKKKERKPRGKPITFKGFKKRDLKYNLVYYEPSPNFCDENAILDVAGTTGRRCNVTDGQPDSCSTLCCGRGYDKAIRKKIDQKCTFVWCCTVDCVNSTVNEEITVCK